MHIHRPEQWLNRAQAASARPRGSRDTAVQRGSLGVCDRIARLIKTHTRRQVHSLPLSAVHKIRRQRWTALYETHQNSKDFMIKNTSYFVWAGREDNQIPPPAQGGAEGSVRLLLTKNPTHSFSCLSCQVRGLSFKRFLRHWQSVGSISGLFNDC